PSAALRCLPDGLCGHTSFALGTVTDLERCAEITEFVLDHYPPAHQWKPKMASDWTSWAAEQGFLFLCYTEPGTQGKLVGLTIARPLSGERMGTEIEDTDFDPEGEVIYTDVAISEAGKPALQAM